MKITNAHNLPVALYESICNDEYSKAGRYSASELPQPPQLTILKRRHDHEIVKDASDFLWLILGKSVHQFLAHHDTRNALKEESLLADLDGTAISGTTDLFDMDVADWKVTSVYSFLLGGLKPEWEAQVNTYAWLWERHGFVTRDLYIHAILRDWQRSKTRERDYPVIPFQTIKVPTWGVAKTENYLRNRLDIYLLAEEMEDDAMPKCSPSDQWARATTWAAMKGSNKRATRLFTSESEAAIFAEKNALGIVERPGKKTRCEDYCDARPWCAQYAAEHKGLEFSEAFPSEEGAPE